MGDFVNRHIGPDADQVHAMLAEIGAASLTQLIEQTVPSAIHKRQPLDLPPARDEAQLLRRAWELAQMNQLSKNYIGRGYYECQTPQVILRNILENPGWYTAYTPYQAEISQGRMEALLNFQTLIMELTGFEIANASLLDEATAAAEAMHLCFASRKDKNARTFFVDENSFEQTVEVLKTRSRPLGIEIRTGMARKIDKWDGLFGLFIQNPGSNGEVYDWTEVNRQAHKHNVLSIMAADILSLCLIQPPAAMDADIAVGSTQRFGVPMGFGGPHAAYMATREEFKRSLPGRIIGVSKDVTGQPALRLALQTREQHIRREKATSNICTAQVLLAVVASMYAVYHGPKGLRKIAEEVHRRTSALASGLKSLGYKIESQLFFDTLTLHLTDEQSHALGKLTAESKINLNWQKSSAGISIDEMKTDEDIYELLRLFAQVKNAAAPELTSTSPVTVLGKLLRPMNYLTQSVFNSHHSETEMMRYMHRLELKDLTLNHSMIPLGSCTMKLNAAAEMQPITWPEFSHIHPFAPRSQTQGYLTLIRELEAWLCEVTGFAAFSLQPNAGSQGEYAGLLVIRKYHEEKGEPHRNVCLIPSSAHGTNPASAIMAGMKVVVVQCDENGNVDLPDLRRKAEAHSKDLAALMITYPSTHGVFEESIIEIVDVIHSHGGQVYMDGANFNAMVGICQPGKFGVDVSHLNLHKTFCIPHGGGGPGVGPIGVADHLKGYLPGMGKLSAVSAAPWGSAGILPISWAYIAMMGPDGLKRASEVAILNANYIAKKLAPHFPVLYTNKKGFVAHECIIDLRDFKASTGVTVDDVAKRLMDFGFHAPTMSWPVAGTLMIEPTESESKAELDRFVEAMIQIRQEISDIESGKMDKEDNVLKNAPHTVHVLLSDNWDHPYSRQSAAFPLAWVKKNKYWPSVGRVDNAYGDKNLICSCAPLEAYEESI